MANVRNGWGVFPVMDIETGKLSEHPGNIRKEYDEEGIEELADSVRSIGLITPLTVIPIPGHEEDLDAFYVVAGNRRLMAARRLNLRSIPCSIIIGMSKKEQIEMMLQENMQRKSLTPYEEGEAFQMLLDLGADEEDIAERTGLSRQTIRHRVEIAKLDRETAKRRLSGDDGDFFQLSLTDLQRLEQIEDVGIRNRLLQEATSGERLAYLVAEEKRRLAREKYSLTAERTLRGKGVKKASGEFLNSGKSKIAAFVAYDGKGFAKELEKAIDEAGKSGKAGKIRFREGYDGITLYEEAKPAAAAEKPREETDAERLRREESAKTGELTAEIRDMVAHIRAMILDVVEGKLTCPALQKDAGTTDLLERCWPVLLADGKTVSVNRAAAFYDGISAARARARQDILDKVARMGAGFQALLSVGYNIDEEEVTGGLFGYGRRYERFRMQPVISLMAILEPYGCVLTAEEERLVLGFSELYANPEKSRTPEPEDAAEEEEAGNDYESTRMVRSGRRLA